MIKVAVILVIVENGARLVTRGILLNVETCVIETPYPQEADEKSLHKSKDAKTGKF